MVNPKFKNRFKTDTFKTNKQGGYITSKKETNERDILLNK